MIDLKLIYEKEIFVYNNPEEFLIKKGDNFYSLSKTNRPNLTQVEVQDALGPFEKCYGVLSILTGVGTDYLLIISEASLAGMLIKNKICKIEQIKFLPFNKNCEYINKSNIEMIEDFLKSNSLYFSDTYDLTNTIVENFNNHPVIINSLGFETIRANFCWNYSFISSISYDCELTIKTNFIFPVINGFMSMQSVGGYENKMNFFLISRKDTRRSGVRYHVRGCDDAGHVANFLESEQIITFLNEGEYDILSHLQIRGSIHLYWSQPSNLSFIPKIIIDQDYSLNSSYFKKHMESLSLYGKVTIVNLIENKGDQLKLGKLFQNISNEVNHDLKDDFLKTNTSKEHNFIWFDFHEECKGGKHENIKKLIKSEKFSNILDANGFNYIKINSSYLFSNSNETKIISEQSGIFRTNCIDCLDRTNVIQTAIGLEVLILILVKLKLFNENSSDLNNKLIKTHKLIWADNGDCLSKSYAGTPAQKGDFTRYGRRTKCGIVKDFLISTRRFFINNMLDGYRHDSHEYFLGNLSPLKIKKRKVFKYVKYYLLFILLFTMTIFYLSKFLLPIKDSYMTNIIFFLLSLFSATKILTFLMIETIYDTPSNIT
jgi:hypothetical protein